MLGRLPLVQEQSPELLLLDGSESIVNDSQHQVHQEVKVYRKICDEEQAGPTVVGVAPHHDVRVTGNKIRFLSSNFQCCKFIILTLQWSGARRG